ncbi:MAG: tetratricopeptide repeat protein, partial [Clostridiales bacterium]
MKTRYMWPAILLIMLIALVLNSQISLSQEKQKPVKDQAKMSKDEIPITTTSQDARQKYIEGLGYLENIQIEKAKSSFQEAVKADPNFALGYFGLAQTGSGFTAIKENYDKAEKNMKNISEGEKHLISFAKSQFEGNTSQAQKEIQQLTNMFPKDKRVHFYAAQLEFNTNRDYDAVIKSLRKAIDIDKNYAPAYNLMGYAYSFKNDFNKAENAFKKYISLAPDNPNPYDSYAELLLKNGRYDE